MTPSDTPDAAPESSPAETPPTAGSDPSESDKRVVEPGLSGESSEEPNLGHEATPPTSPRETGLWGWLWQPARGKWLLGRMRDESEALRTLRKRSQAWFLAAERLYEQRDLQEEADLDCVIDGLYANAVVLALHVEDLQAGGGSTESPRGRREISDVWKRVEPNISALLPEGVPAEGLVRTLTQDSIEAVPGDTTFHDGLRQLAQRLMSRGRSLQGELDALWLRRSVRVILPLILVLVAVLVSIPLAWQARIKRETSYPWETSSVFADPGCTSPAQSCAEDRFFFCTKEEDRPWIRFDLGKVRSLSSISVKNRTDCPGCADRAAPLVVEVSLDGEKWKEVARKGESFDSWSPSFPKTEARWLRLRAEKKTYLHLKQVRIPEP